MKKTVARFAFNMAVIGVAVSLGTASAMTSMQQQTVGMISQQIPKNISQQMVPNIEEIVSSVVGRFGGPQGAMGGSPQTFVSTPGQPVWSGGQINMGPSSVAGRFGGPQGVMGGGPQTFVSTPGQPVWSGGQINTGQQSGTFMPQVNIGQVVDNALQSVSAQNRNRMNQSIQTRALSGLNGNNVSLMAARRNIRNQIMYDRFGTIYPFASNSYRQVIMPGAILSMINQIQPYRYPDRFRSRMMPETIRSMSNQVKIKQQAYMQQGIIGNPQFPDFSNEFYQGRMW